MPTVTNISCYQFAPLADLKLLRQRLFDLCREWKLKGTILLSVEGINLFVAGLAAEIEKLLKELRAIPGLETLTPKVSESAEAPFSRMLVKIKKEIIAFGIPGIDPVHKPAPRISARDLKQWLDEGRPVTLLDTRNDYEVELGTFDHALPIGVKHFRDFPAAVRKLPEHLKKAPIVTFCTGGIRCEKAAPFMQNEGFEDIYQLDGGILKYFEECGGAHYHGECFVFDKRVGVGEQLEESSNGQCYVCQMLLTEEEQNDPRFEMGKSCPHCYRTSEDHRIAQQQEFQAAIPRMTNPLPGSTPQDNFRPIKISQSQDGRELLEVLQSILGHLEYVDWPTEFEQNHIVNSSHAAVKPNHTVRAGERYYHKQPLQIEPAVNADIKIVYADNSIIVVNKPAPLPTHPSGRFNRNSLQSILNLVFAPQKLRPCHRLDANTTGIVVFARTSTIAKQLQPQFERGEVEKTYLAKVIGHPKEDQFTCKAAIGENAIAVGLRDVCENGLPARTDFKVLKRNEDGTSLLEVIPQTGRTNQIRVHLWHLSLPIVGDQAYLPNHQKGEIQTHTINDLPMCLHALQISFIHPQKKERMTFTAVTPEWAK